MGFLQIEIMGNKKPVYGGQAVVEGVMIRGEHHVSIAVRRPDGTIASKREPLNPIYTGFWRKIPILRGILVLTETMMLGINALIYSANVGAEAEGEKIGKVSIAITLSFSLMFAIGLFFLLPVFASKGFEGIVNNDIYTNAIEGIIRLLLLVGYIFLIGRLSEIKRVFMYHGAEHMTIHAQEHGVPLDISSIRKYPTAHPRCGTAFLLTVMVIAVFVFTFVGREPLWWLLISRVVLIPLIAAVSYEVIRFAGGHDNKFIVRTITWPNIALQSLTTRQPEDEQIEIAVEALKGAIEADRSI